MPRQLAAGGVPPEVGGADGRRRLGADALTGVGDLGAAILAAAPAPARGRRSSRSSRPSSPPSTSAFSIATASTFMLGIVASLAAAGLVLLLREAPAPATEPGLAHEDARAPGAGMTPTAS